MKSALLEFLEHGLKYVFPQQPGAIVKGIVTAYSAPALTDEIQSSELIVWPYFKGNVQIKSEASEACRVKVLITML
jgi:hypothetical protein